MKGGLLGIYLINFQIHLNDWKTIKKLYDHSFPKFARFQKSSELIGILRRLICFWDTLTIIKVPPRTYSSRRIICHVFNNIPKSFEHNCEQIPISATKLVYVNSIYIRLPNGGMMFMPSQANEMTQTVFVKGTNHMSKRMKRLPTIYHQESRQVTLCFTQLFRSMVYDYFNLFTFLMFMV